MKKTTETRELFRIPEASAYLGNVIKPDTLRQWIWRRRIEHVHLGRTVCIPKHVLDRLVDENTVPALNGSDVFDPEDRNPGEGRGRKKRAK